MIAKRLSKVFPFSVVHVKSGTWVGGKETLNSTAKQRGGNNSNSGYTTKEWLSRVIITKHADSCWTTINDTLKMTSQVFYLSMYLCESTIQIRKFYFWSVQESSGVSSCPWAYCLQAIKGMEYAIPTQFLSAKSSYFFLRHQRKRAREV